jgi:hypothetical protein
VACAVNAAWKRDHLLICAGGGVLILADNPLAEEHLLKPS